jgi:hypothetical protein
LGNKINNNNYYLFMYLLNSQWPITDSARILKPEFLKTSVDLQTEFSEETQRAEGQRLEELVNVVKLHKFRVGTRMPTVSQAEGQHLAPLQTFIKNKALV